MNLEKILTKAGQIKDVVYSLEGALIDADNGSEPIGRAQTLLYVLIEQLDSLEEELDQLNGHVHVCNAIYAINRVQELKNEIDRLKSQK